MKASWDRSARAGVSVALCSLLSFAIAGCSGDETTSTGGTNPAGGIFNEEPPNPYADEPRTFEPTACKHKLADGSKTQCGYLQVPEDHTNPESPLIKVYATIYPALTPSNALPLIYLTGGPGTSTADATAIFEDTQAPYRALFGGSRDLIVLDQRGTNYAEPSLYCSEELDDARQQAYAMSLGDAMKLRLEKLKLCRERLVSSGVHLDAFDTYQSAADVRHLALALGHEKVSLYGASYGTRLTMTVMKLFPELVESAVIDSILPPEVNPFEAQAEGVAYALASLWDLTKTEFPDLETDFYDTIKSLEINPIKVTVQYPVNGTPTDVEVTVTGVEYVQYVTSALRATPINATLPANIVDMRLNGDFSVVAQSYLSTVDFLFTTGGAGDASSQAIGMFESINGAADAYYTDAATIGNYIDHYLEADSIRAWAHNTFIDQSAAVSGQWQVDPLPKDVLQPLISDIPTLMLVGVLDTGTPLPFSLSSANYLSRHYYFELLAGHAVCYNPCASTMLDNFLKDPMTKPSNDCPTDPMWSTTANAP